MCPRVRHAALVAARDTATDYRRPLDTRVARRRRLSIKGPARAGIDDAPMMMHARACISTAVPFTALHGARQKKEKEEQETQEDTRR